MSREIKFDVRIRRKDGTDGWDQVYTLEELLDRNGCLYNTNLCEVVYKRMFTVGDIVHHKDSHKNPCDIRWDEYHAQFLAVDSRGAEWSISHGWCEVVGNIYEEKGSV